MSRLGRLLGSRELRVSGALWKAPRGGLSATPYIAYFAILVIVAFLADPLSFTRSWNEGRSAMLAIVPLVFLEAGRRSLAPLGGGKKAFLAWLTLGAAAVYYFAFAQPSVFNSIVSLGTSLGVSPTIVQFSWVWGIDYAVTSVFLVSLLLLDRGSKTITPLIYTVGMASFLFIDVLLPENTLGPFGVRGPSRAPDRRWDARPLRPRGSPLAWEHPDAPERPERHEPASLLAVRGSGRDRDRTARRLCDLREGWDGVGEGLALPPSRGGRARSWSTCSGSSSWQPMR